MDGRAAIIPQNLIKSFHLRQTLESDVLAILCPVQPERFRSRDIPSRLASINLGVPLVRLYVVLSVRVHFAIRTF